MPRYFFHLAFGARTVPDEEGFELPDRSAAQAEAMTRIRELSHPRTGGNSRRWAGWFLELVDNQGQFFRAPIGHPALELVTPSLAKSASSVTASAGQAAPSAPTQVAEVVWQLSTRQQHAEELLEHSRRLQHELSSLSAANERIRARARELVAYARLVTSQGDNAGIFQVTLARLSRPPRVA